MDVPLARYLARFPMDDDPVVEEPAIEEAEAEIVPVEDPAETRLAAALAEADAQHAEELASFKAKAESDSAEALTLARAEWCESEGTKLAARIDEAMPQLRTYLADRIADALTPLVTKAVVERTRAALMASLDTLLADESHAAITIHAPADLIDAVRAARPEANGIRYVAHEDIDAVITADGLRIQTRLASALQTLAEAGA